MKEIKANDSSYQLITTWSELNRRQALNIAYARYQLHDKNSNETYYSLSIALFTDLCTIPKRITDDISAKEWVDLIKYVSWTFEKPELRTNLVPYIPGRRLSFLKHHFLYGPVGLMDESTFKEFTEADTVFLAYNKKRDIKNLWLLLAILYRPMRSDIKAFKSSSDWNGDVREPYNHERMQLRAARLERSMPAYFATYALLYYWSVRNLKLTNNKRLQSLFAGDNSGGAANAGWLDTTLEMSNTKFGTMQQTENHNWLMVLYELARQKDIAKNRKTK